MQHDAQPLDANDSMLCLSRNVMVLKLLFECSYLTMQIALLPGR